MGCNESKTVKVQPVGSLEMKSSKLRKTESEIDPIDCDIDDKHNKRGKSSKSRKSRDGTMSPDSDRGGSAGSKKSNDSGLGELGEENMGFITEYSDPDKVRNVEDEFKERDDLELGVTGVALPTRNSAKDKARLEESMIIQKLREEGLISKPAAEKSGGVSFDIFDMTSGAKLPALPSIRLAKLERRRKKKRTLTEDEIQEKLHRAEERRKRKEQARLERIKELDKADHTAALESFQDYQKKKEEQVTQKMESVVSNKERRLLEIKEKQLERERRREEVRRRKREQKEREAQNGGSGESGDRDPAESLDREETPMVPE